jgi:hypothetical protein
MTAIRDEISAANLRLSADAGVTAILFDSEHFHARQDDDQWNAARPQKRNRTPADNGKLALLQRVLLPFPPIRSTIDSI